MNGFDEATWQELLHDPRIGGEGAYTGPGWESPPPWQHDVSITESVGDAYYALPDAVAPVTVMSNVPLDELGIPSL